jgi:diguanylate cyclase (GGDEF)-like protein
VDLIVVMTSQGEIRYLSPELRRLLALPEHARSSDLAALLHPDDLGMLRSLITDDMGPWPRRARVRIGPGPPWRDLDLEADDRRDDPTFGGYVITAKEVTAGRGGPDRTDALTGMPNRQVFMERLDELLASGHDGQVAVLLFDLDRFRTVNHSLGHSVGDALLARVAERLQQAAAGQGFIARLGGDEFGLVYRCDPLAPAPEQLAAILLRALAHPFVLRGLDVTVHCSVGIAIDRDGFSAEQLLQAADTALYDAKSEGRHRISIYTSIMGLAVQERHALRSGMPKALSQGEFEMWYQPIVELGSGELRSFEALARWRSPEHGLVSPTRFIPLAEESGLIVELGRWALETACAQLASWRSALAGAARLSIAVNASGRQLDEDRFPAQIAGALLAAGLPADRLTIEVTESLILSEQAITRLGILRDLGVTLAIDDFGTGQSSLGRLQRVPVHVLKLDRSFVSPLDEREQAGVAYLSAIARMATSLGLRTVAEGVETHRHLHLVRSAGLDTVQGYLFGRPAPAAAFTQLLATRHPVLEPSRWDQSASGA